MSIITQTTGTLAEAIKLAGWDPGSMGELQKRHALIDETPWRPTSHGMHNKQVQALSLAQGSWGKVNSGIPSGVSHGAVIEEPVKIYELESPVDTRLLRGMTPAEAKAYRDAQDEMTLEGVLAGFTNGIIYGNDGQTPDAPRGLIQRRASLGTYCLGAGGTSGASAWLLELGQRGFHFAYPSGTMPGIRSEDKGEQRVAAADSSGYYYAWVRKFEAWAAMVLRDERALVRIANIDSTHALTADLVIQARNLTPSMGSNSVLLVTRDSKTALDKAAYNKTNLAITTSELPGYGHVTFVGGVPIRLEEELLASGETTVS